VLFLVLKKTRKLFSHVSDSNYAAELRLRYVQVPYKNLASMTVLLVAMDLIVNRLHLHVEMFGFLLKVQKVFHFLKAMLPFIRLLYGWCHSGFSRTKQFI
jgi:hypothetical protein